MAGASYDAAMIPWDEYRYVVFADLYGWTPAEVDDLPLSLEPWIIPIHNAITEDQNRRQEHASRQAQQKAELEQKLAQHRRNH